eukprot:scaffold55364_cov18-Tisochrysis_lutea.AAC.1
MQQLALESSNQRPADVYWAHNPVNCNLRLKRISTSENRSRFRTNPDTQAKSKRNVSMECFNGMFQWDISMECFNGMILDNFAVLNWFLILAT